VSEWFILVTRLIRPYAAPKVSRARLRDPDSLLDDGRASALPSGPFRDAPPCRSARTVRGAPPGGGNCLIRPVPPTTHWCLRCCHGVGGAGGARGRYHHGTGQLDLHDNIVQALVGVDPRDEEGTRLLLDVLRVRRFARKTREYKRAYIMMHGLFGQDSAAQKVVGHRGVEKFAKRAKTHRSAYDQDRAFVARV